MFMTQRWVLAMNGSNSMTRAKHGNLLFLSFLFITLPHSPCFKIPQPGLDSHVHMFIFVFVVADFYLAFPGSLYFL
ncbi:hypothetical protein F5148DRAFT_1237751, partial [Russula earlei]